MSGDNPLVIVGLFILAVFLLVNFLIIPILKMLLPKSKNGLDETVSDSFGDGGFLNSISRIQATLGERGLGSIVSRRIFEPRKGWPKDEQEKL